MQDIKGLFLRAEGGGGGGGRRENGIGTQKKQIQI